MRDAGIIGFVPRGEYSDTETYDFLHFVYFEGSTYVAKKETAGNAPAENNEYWQILARGQVGEFLPIDGTAKNSEKLEGYGVTKTSSKIYGAIPRVDDSGVLGIGKYIDFHKSETDFTDFYIRVTAKDDGLYIGNNKILVKGDALSSSGGTIASATQQMLNLRYTGEKGDAIIQLFPNNLNKRIAIQASYKESNGAVFRIFKIDDGVVTQLLDLSSAGGYIFDPKTNTMKPIIVEGDDIGDCIVNGKKLSEWLK